MKSTTSQDAVQEKQPIHPNDTKSIIEQAVTSSWQKIAPFWPLRNLVAVNPIAGFESLAFEHALEQAHAYFQTYAMPQKMELVNRYTMKWLQAFFDEGQATLHMPNRHLGLLKSSLIVMQHDRDLHGNKLEKKQWLQALPQAPHEIIFYGLQQLNIPFQRYDEFLTLLLTTLPGWAAYIQYRTSWADAHDTANPHTVTQQEYLAFRVIVMCLLWSEGQLLLDWHYHAKNSTNLAPIIEKLIRDEENYQKTLFEQFKILQAPSQVKRPSAQLAFCIDVRSEPFRKALEAQGQYETLGIAGFFGVPVSVENSVTGDSYASCPVLLKPAHEVVETVDNSEAALKRGYKNLQRMKKTYQSVKYTFTTPFNLAEALGLVSGLWMGLKTLLPNLSAKLQSKGKHCFISEYQLNPAIHVIPIEEQLAYSANALEIIGLTQNFAPLVVFCGHGSKTENNAYASALDCGACGGRHGAPNARILAAMLNRQKVREALSTRGIEIPADTVFLAAEHNTTTDEVALFAHDLPASHTEQVTQLSKALVAAGETNLLWRSRQMGNSTNKLNTKQTLRLRSKDWSQVRPEWGLARNAAFIVAPRWFSQEADLDGRAFLHSYEWQQDTDGSNLAAILTAPMVVAQWINAQYFFSTLDNIAYGGGSKITKNITGKIGIMQGNASDLMHGLPLQSVYSSDNECFHQVMRLTVVVYAPKQRIDNIIKEHDNLQRLFRNGWVHLVCYEPNKQSRYHLARDLTWIQ